MCCEISSPSVEHFLETYATQNPPDVLLQDIGLPGMSGLAAIRLIKDKMPSTDIIMFSVYDDSERIFQAFCAGASGYVLKNTQLTDLRKAILTVHAGEAVMSPAIAKKVIAHFRPSNDNGPLTHTEQRVVQLLTDGLSYKMIAARMQVSINTVGSHIKNIYKKLQVNSKAEVIAKKLKGEI